MSDVHIASRIQRLHKRHVDNMYGTKLLFKPERPVKREITSQLDVQNQQEGIIGPDIFVWLNYAASNGEEKVQNILGEMYRDKALLYCLVE